MLQLLLHFVSEKADFAKGFSVHLSTTWGGVHVARREAGIPGEVAPLAVVLLRGRG